MTGKRKVFPFWEQGQKRTSRTEKKRGVGEAIEGEKGDCEGGEKRKDRKRWVSA